MRRWPRRAAAEPPCASAPRRIGRPAPSLHPPDAAARPAGACPPCSASFRPSPRRDAGVRAHPPPRPAACPPPRARAGAGLAGALLLLAGLLLATPAQAQGTDANLAALELLHTANSQILFNETFSPSTTSYTAEVPHYADVIEIDPDLSDSNAGYVIQDGDGNTLTDAYPVTLLGSDNTSEFMVTLAVGANTFKVVVTAEDGNTTKTYTVVVTRAAQATGTEIWSATLTSGANKGYCDGVTLDSGCDYGSLSDEDFTPGQHGLCGQEHPVGR